MSELKLIALDAEDLSVLSANLQDAVLRIADIAYLPREKRFAAIANRFDWATATDDKGTYARRRSAKDNFVFHQTLVAFALPKAGEKEIDIGVIAALKPDYAPAPSIDDEGRLLVKGFFPTEPLRVDFDLAFIPSDGEWKLIRLNVKVDTPS